MIGGLARYFQIVKGSPDEDLRADRQPEFTQLDVEMSFPRQEDVFHVIESVMVRACAVAGITAHAPFLRLPHKQALSGYGTDKPDLRFGMEMTNLSLVFANKILTGDVQPPVWGFVAPGCARYS